MLNKGLQDKRISVKRLAALSVLNIASRVYLERALHFNENDDNEINAEIRELKKNIKSVVFLESFRLTFPHRLEKRLSCEDAGIKEESLLDVSESILG